MHFAFAGEKDTLIFVCECGLVPSLWNKYVLLEPYSFFPRYYTPCEGRFIVVKHTYSAIDLCL